VSRLCIIPARGGSKRIKRKNIRSFLGEPIISYSITAALKSELFSEVMVSTDDDEIAATAKRYGASVPFLRSADNSDDYATTLAVIREVLDVYTSLGQVFKEVTCLYATAPFVKVSDLKLAHQRLFEEDLDCVFPVLRFSFPIQRALRFTELGHVTMVDPAQMHVRSQDLEPRFQDAGMFYCFRPERILEKGRLWTDLTGAIEIKELEAHDIDTEMDWKMAELKYRLTMLHE